MRLACDLVREGELMQRRKANEPPDLRFFTIRPGLEVVLVRRVVIIGCSGAGKSTFARTLARQSNLPLIHIDREF